MRTYTVVLAVKEVLPAMKDDGVELSDLFEVMHIDGTSIDEVGEQAKRSYAEALCAASPDYEGAEVVLVAVFNGEQLPKRSECAGIKTYRRGDRRE